MTAVPLRVPRRAPVARKSSRVVCQASSAPQAMVATALALTLLAGPALANEQKALVRAKGPSCGALSCGSKELAGRSAARKAALDEKIKAMKAGTAAPAPASE